MALILHVNFPAPRELSTHVSPMLANRLYDSRIDNHRVFYRDGCVHVRCMFAQRNRVPDVDRYRLTRHPSQDGCKVRIREGWFLVAHTGTNIECDPYNDRLLSDTVTDQRPTIVVVLESPHKFEYRNTDVAHPIAPACGLTGVKIQDVLLDMLIDSSGVTLRENTRLIIANPVPYQTSLYSICRYRDLSPYTRCRIKSGVWNALWNYTSIREDFEKRMRSYSPYITINACTTEFAGRVNEAILALRIGLLYQTEHPSAPKFWTERNHVMERVSAV